MIAEMKAVSLSCNDPSHDGHAIHLPEPFSAVYGKSATSDRISLVFACPMMEVNTTETFLLRCKKLAWEEVEFEKLDGRNPAPVEVGSLSHYFQGFTHPRWCRISSINSSPVFIRPLKSIGSKHH